MSEHRKTWYRINRLTREAPLPERATNEPVDIPISTILAQEESHDPTEDWNSFADSTSPNHEYASVG